MVEVIDQKIVKARKEHKCSWCHGTIEIGEEYESATCKSADHGIYTWKNHRHCKELADGLDMFTNSWDDGLSDDEFAECIYEYLQENNWFITDADMDIEGSLYAEEKFQDWIDDNNWDDMTLKAYEIYKGKQAYKLVKHLFPDMKSTESKFVTEYSSTFPEEIEYIGRYTGHKYEIKKVDKEETGVEFIVTFDDYSGLKGGGDTVDEALIMAKEALDMWLEVKKEENENE